MRYPTALQRGQTPVGQVEPLVIAVQEIQQHLLVVAQEEDAAVRKAQQVLHHLPGLGPAVNVVADEDQFISRSGRDLLQQPLKRLQAPVDVPDDVGRALIRDRRGSREAFRRPHLSPWEARAGRPDHAALAAQVFGRWR